MVVKKDLKKVKALKVKERKLAKKRVAKKPVKKKVVKKPVKKRVVKKLSDVTPKTLGAPDQPPTPPNQPPVVPVQPPVVPVQPLVVPVQPPVVPGQPTFKKGVFKKLQDLFYKQPVISPPQKKQPEVIPQILPKYTFNREQESNIISPLRPILQKNVYKIARDREDNIQSPRINFRLNDAPSPFNKKAVSPTAPLVVPQKQVSVPVVADITKALQKSVIPLVVPKSISAKQVIKTKSVKITSVKPAPLVVPQKQESVPVVADITKALQKSVSPLVVPQSVKIIVTPPSEKAKSDIPKGNDLIYLNAKSMSDSYASIMQVVSKNCGSLQNFPFHKEFLKQISEEGFTCQKELGSGGFGTTYLFSSEKGEKIAVKAIQAKRSLDITVKNEIDVLERFKNKCSEEHLLCYKKIYNYESPKVQEKGIYIITEFIEGFDMFELIGKRNISHHQFVNLLSQAITALEYIHSVGIIHYDIKPENIMITKDCTLKIIDFGGAKVSTDGNKSIPIYTTYTPSYAPKDLKFQETNPFSYGEYFDFYSLGQAFVGFDHKESDIQTKSLLNLFDIMDYSNYKDILSQIKEMIKGSRVSIPLQKSKSVSVKQTNIPLQKSKSVRAISIKPIVAEKQVSVPKLAPIVQDITKALQKSVRVKQTDIPLQKSKSVRAISIKPIVAEKQVSIPKLVPIVQDITKALQKSVSVKQTDIPLQKSKSVKAISIKPIVAEKQVSISKLAPITDALKQIPKSDSQKTIKASDFDKFKNENGVITFSPSVVSHIDNLNCKAYPKMKGCTIDCNKGHKLCDIARINAGYLTRIGPGKYIREF